MVGQVATPGSLKEPDHTTVTLASPNSSPSEKLVDEDRRVVRYSNSAAVWTDGKAFMTPGLVTYLGSRGVKMQMKFVNGLKVKLFEGQVGFIRWQTAPSFDKASSYGARMLVVLLLAFCRYSALGSLVAASIFLASASSGSVARFHTALRAVLIISEQFMIETPFYPWFFWFSLLIRRSCLKDKGCILAPTTAIHNFFEPDMKNIENSAFFYNAADPAESFYWRVHFSERNQEPEEKLGLDVVPDGNKAYRLSPSYSEIHHDWKYGQDITFGTPFFVDPTVEGSAADRRLYETAFTAVRPDFAYETGQRVGIAVFSTVGPSNKSISDTKTTYAFTAAELEALYGRTHRVNIYTGIITRVGLHHIEYSMNSFKGCSGSIVFLLDKNQPESVSEVDYGCAIAVHAGGHPSELKRNVGFKILTAPKPTPYGGFARQVYNIFEA
mmetsp:Transcript_22270/g.26770  ORF Transcript_22270/g.26770 Transcript_22270/m.26770 type:complete len:440 (-) Transcript_22270:793-2112(-)